MEEDFLPEYRVLSWSRVGKHQNLSPDPEYIRAQQMLAVRAFDLLAGRDVFFLARSAEDAEQCLESAMSIRSFFEQAGYNAYGGPLYDSLKRIRDASRSFVRAAGTDARFFLNDSAFFSAMLQTYRETVGSELAWLAHAFELPVDDRIVAVLPQQDLRLERLP